MNINLLFRVCFLYGKTLGFAFADCIFRSIQRLAWLLVQFVINMSGRKELISISIKDVRENNLRLLPNASNTPILSLALKGTSQGTIYRKSRLSIYIYALPELTF